MKEAGVPIVPGSEGGISDPAEAADLVEAIGYPVMLEAGSRRRRDRDEDRMGGEGPRPCLESAQSIARSALSDETVYVEKYLTDPRHIESQILADSKGETIYRPDRECSIQRRHQKLIEESPSPIMTPGAAG